MDSFRKINRWILLLWSLLLSLLLLCAQDVKLHAHDMNHEQSNHSNNYHSHAYISDETDAHGYLGKAHFTHDTSHSNHHDKVIPEVDISPDRLLKNTGSNAFAIILFAFFFTVLFFVSSRQLVQRCRESQLILRSCHLFSPPLRAPPQH